MAAVNDRLRRSRSNRARLARSAANEATNADRGRGRRRWVGPRRSTEGRHSTGSTMRQQTRAADARSRQPVHRLPADVAGRCAARLRELRRDRPRPQRHLRRPPLRRRRPDADDVQPGGDDLPGDYSPNGNRVVFARSTIRRNPTGSTPSRSTQPSRQLPFPWSGATGSKGRGSRSRRRRRSGSCGCWRGRSRASSASGRTSDEQDRASAPTAQGVRVCAPVDDGPGRAQRRTPRTPVRPGRAGGYLLDDGLAELGAHPRLELGCRDLPAASTARDWGDERRRELVIVDGSRSCAWAASFSAPNQSIRRHRASSAEPEAW
jgi:hypothetical protein